MRERPKGRIKVVPEDFVVEEIPLYEPSGDGEHLYVTFTKTGLTTERAVQAIARALLSEPRAAGYAGQKDKVGVTTQTASFPMRLQIADAEARALALSLPGIEVHAAKRHKNKLKPGHLFGNRFTIRVRDLSPEGVEAVRETLSQVEVDGAPNYFGSQRFGTFGDNARVALRWLSGEERAPLDPRTRRFHFSSVQADIFNRVLQRRVEEGTWNKPQLGDILKVHASGGLFLCADPDVDQKRAMEKEVSPTGPLWGISMRHPEGVILDLERTVAEEVVGPEFPWEKTKALGEGTRRALRILPTDIRVTGEEGGAKVEFVLPKGAYATTVLLTAIDLEGGADEAS